MKTLKESILDDQNEIMDRGDELAKIINWEENYCDNSHFKRGRDYTIENGVIIPKLISINLGQSMNLNEVKIKWPEHINTLCIMYDERYMDAKWWKDNFNEIDIYHLFIRLDIGGIFNPKVVCQSVKIVTNLHIDGEENGGSKVIIPANLRCAILGIQRCPHVKFSAGELPCDEIRISKHNIIR